LTAEIRRGSEIHRLGAEVGVSPLGGGGREHRARPDRGRRNPDQAGPGPSTPGAITFRVSWVRVPPPAYRESPANTQGFVVFEPRSLSVLTLGREGIAEITTFLGAELRLRFGLPDEL
jgi:hypothetical protein